MLARKQPAASALAGGWVAGWTADLPHWPLTEAAHRCRRRWPRCCASSQTAAKAPVAWQSPPESWQWRREERAAVGTKQLLRLELGPGMGSAPREGPLVASAIRCGSQSGASRRQRRQGPCLQADSRGREATRRREGVRWMPLAAGGGSSGGAWQRARPVPTTHPRPQRLPARCLCATPCASCASGCRLPWRLPPADGAQIGGGSCAARATVAAKAACRQAAPMRRQLEAQSRPPKPALSQSQPHPPR